MGLKRYPQKGGKLKWYSLWFTQGRLDINILVHTTSKERARKLSFPVAREEADRYGDEGTLICRAVVPVGPGTREPDYLTESSLDAEGLTSIKPHTPFVEDSGT